MSPCLCIWRRDKPRKMFAIHLYTHAYHAHTYPKVIKTKNISKKSQNDYWLRKYVGKMQDCTWTRLFCFFEFVCLHVCPCSCVCKCVHVNVTRGWHWVPSLIFLYLILWDRVAHWTWSLSIWLNWLATKPQGYSSLCLPGTEITGVCHSIQLFFKFFKIF